MTPDALSGFHPAVAGWFRSRFPAPIGSGKTLTAFLSAINDLVVVVPAIAASAIWWRFSKG